MPGPGRRSLAGWMALGLVPWTAHGQEPAPGEVTLLVGAAPGSAADSWARGFAPFLERHWPHASIAIANRAGEGGLAAARALAAAVPDGRLVAAIGTPLLLARAVEARATPLLRHLAFLAAVAEEPLVLVGLAGSLDDLDGLRAQGADAILGTPAHGSAPHLAALAFGRHLPVSLLPFPNAAAARQAVLAGNIPCALLGLPDAIAALRDGRLSGLGLAQERRSELLPDVPTLGEQGVPVRLAAHRGFAVAAGTDPAMLAPLVAALRNAVADPEFAEQAAFQGYVPIFLGQAAWEPLLQRTTAELEERWSHDPWTTRRD